ncbi:MAG TPA: hypothetical protein VHW01_12940 [Polyangiaceae bacterium]|jgi:hypothetical protein|nr:hypothetical protein [Polyangiaceae bacterium]
MRSTTFSSRAPVRYGGALSVLVFALSLLVGCGGKSQSSNAGAGDSVGGVSSSGSAGSAGQELNCPEVEPAEGAACANRGQVCAGFGSLSCPDTAKCGSDGTWQIECPAMPLGPKCSCAHQLGGDAGAPFPLNHRPSGLPCTAARAPVTPTPSGFMCTPPGGAECQCTQDSDCTAGQNGRCQPRSPGPAGLQCSYDYCHNDDGCPQSSVCECRPDAGSQIANYCTKPGTCRVDSDCGVGGFCSPSQAGQWCGTLYFCHTPGDTCLNDSDCPSAGISPGCNFDLTSRHWACGGGCGPVPP